MSLVLKSPPEAANELVDDRNQLRVNWGMRPLDIQPIGGELAIKWEDGSESFVPLEKLRRYCPCAGCQGEADIMGNVYRGPEKALQPSAFQLMRVANVGSYAIQPIWGDGHATGIYSFDYLRKVADAP